MAIVVAAFLIDGTVRGFIWGAYGANPASSLVLTAIANTTALETSEFVLMYWPRLIAWALFTLVCLGLLFSYLLLWWRQPRDRLPLKGWRFIVTVLLLALVLAATASKPWRRHHPLVFWPHWAGEVISLRGQWAQSSDHRENLLLRAIEQMPVITQSSPDTLVLVIGDSVNRSHLSLYGYARDTSPELVARQRLDSRNFGVFDHAWSVDASTIAALRNFFYFGQDGVSRQHLLALASRAGYALWWISNHDDLAIDREHAQLADRVQMINKTPGRSSLSMDGATLPLLEQALKDTAPRKLIVMHLFGAHPHYQLRHPAERAPFRHVRDAVYEHMKEQGRSVRVRGLRNDYDSAIHYHDSVVAATLDLTRQLGGKSTWLYFSDHGQEVGSVSDHAGHSVTSADGYRVPLLIWSSGAASIPGHVFQQPVRTDWLGYSVMNLLGIAWQGHHAQRDVLDPAYRWIDPALPVAFNFRP